MAATAGAQTPPATPAAALPQVPAYEAQARTDQNSILAHQQHLAKLKQGTIDVYFQGDSIARRWGATDYPQFLANWKQNFWGWNAADFAWGADRTQNILWRLQNGELDGITPRVIVFLGGTNNVGAQPFSDARVAEITRGIKAVLDLMHEKVPTATIILTAIFPRNDNATAMLTIKAVNDNLAKLADGKTIRFVNVNAQMADADGRLFDDVMNADRLHPSLKGYQIWADALTPILTELLGSPAMTDSAPPPTGDPSATR